MRECYLEVGIAGSYACCGCSDLTLRGIGASPQYRQPANQQTTNGLDKEARH